MEQVKLLSEQEKQALFSGREIRVVLDDTDSDWLCGPSIIGYAAYLDDDDDIGDYPIETVNVGFMPACVINA